MTRSKQTGWETVFPSVSWLRDYQRSWFRFDIVAGVTLAAYLLPAALGDASLANLPPEAGLYACLFGGLVFWLFCSSRHTAITVTSAISLLLGASLGGLANGDPSRFRALAVCTALLVGVIAFAAWLFSAGTIVNFISESVMLGFKCGVALLGDVPRGLPAFRLPAVAWNDVNELLPLAFACFLLGAVETSAVGRMFVAKHGGRLNSNQELLALSAANFAAGLGQGFPVSGGMSQSLVNESGGARTPLSGFIAAVIVLLVAVFLSRSLHNLPQPVLAAVVLVAVAGLFKVSALKQLWKIDKTEFVTAMAALLGVLGSGLL